MRHTNKFSKWTNTKEFLILHHTGNPHLKWNLNVLDWKTNIDVSCHYLVDHEWIVYKWWNENKIYWHCWVSSWNWRTNLNRFSIWIEVLWPHFTDKQKLATKELILDICERNKIPKENILRHKDISPWRKVDIDDSFWNNEHPTYKDYIDSLFSKKNNMSKYEKIRENVLSETWFTQIFNSHDGENQLTEWEIKDLIEIAFARFYERLSWKK